MRELLKSLPGLPSHAGLEGLVASDDVLQSGRAEEVLLLQPQLLPLKHLPKQTVLSVRLWTKGVTYGGAYIVVGVENTSDVLSQVAIQHGLDVVPMIDCSPQGQFMQCVQCV